MDQLTQGNAANAEETASAAEEMSAQSLELINIVAELQEMVGGATRTELNPPKLPKHSNSSAKGKLVDKGFDWSDRMDTSLKDEPSRLLRN